MIPFKLSKQKAIDKFLEMCKRKWFLPKNFVSEKHFDKLTGVYFPYWYVDEQRSAQMVAKGERFVRGLSEMTVTRKQRFLSSTEQAI